MYHAFLLFSLSFYHDNNCKNYDYHHILDLIYNSLIFSLFYQTQKYCLIFDTIFFSILFFYSNVFIVAAYCRKAFSGKTSLPFEK